MLRMFLNKANRGHAKHMVLSNKSYSFIFTRKHIFTKKEPMIYKTIFKDHCKNYNRNCFYKNLFKLDKILKLQLLQKISPLPNDKKTKF